MTIPDYVTLGQLVEQVTVRRPGRFAASVTAITAPFRCHR
jgi:hypothetical protein